MSMLEHIPIFQIGKRQRMQGLPKFIFATVSTKSTLAMQMYSLH